MANLPVIDQQMLLAVNVNHWRWPTINLDHIIYKHCNLVCDSGEFCPMDRPSLERIVKAVMLYGRIVEHYKYCGKDRYRIAANFWIPIGFSASTGEATHKVTVRYSLEDHRIGTAYPGGVP